MSMSNSNQNESLTSISEIATNQRAHFKTDDSFDEYVFDDVGTEEEEYDHSEDEQEEEDEDVEEDDGDDDESSIESDEENDEIPCKKLRLEVIDDLSSNYDEQVERYQEEGSSKNVAKASNFLLPSYRKKLRGLYLHYLKWIRRLKSDHIHKEVMATLRRYMDEDDMDFEEAAVKVSST
ncbi:hypothetical protein ACROYT_G005420 [Oculina patagonica]